MPKLTLDDELAAKFTAGLLTIVRTDGVVNPVEGKAIKDVVGELIDGSVDLAEAMLQPVSPSSLAAAVRATGDRAPEIAAAFLDAARRVAGADGELTAHETTVIQRYASALGL